MPEARLARTRANYTTPPTRVWKLHEASFGCGILAGVLGTLFFIFALLVSL